MVCLRGSVASRGFCLFGGRVCGFDGFVEVFGRVFRRGFVAVVGWV